MHVCVYVSFFLLAVKLRDRVSVLIGRAYKSIRVSDLCALLGQPEGEINKGEGTEIIFFKEHSCG